MATVLAAEGGADLSTWLFLGALGGATLAVLGFYGASIRGWSPPRARPDLVTPSHFDRVRGPAPEVDLGRGWRSTDDPGAAWHLWWMPATGELVGLRTSALPPPPGPFYLGPVGPANPLDAVGVHKYTGMKVLGHLGDRPPRALVEDLRDRPDGLDLLTGGTRAPTPTDGP
jgi:hypothetical protein